jgi:hypothetical protein
MGTAGLVLCVVADVYRVPSSERLTWLLSTCLL